MRASSSLWLLTEKCRREPEEKEFQAAKSAGRNTAVPDALIYIGLVTKDVEHARDWSKMPCETKIGDFERITITVSRYKALKIKVNASKKFTGALRNH